MKAIRVHEFGGPDVLRIESDVPLPRTDLQADGVLVKVHAVGLNPVETYIREGKYAKLPELPYIPGHDAAGIVEAVGSGVTRVKRGDRVFVFRTESGAYASHTLAKECEVRKLPANASFEQGAAATTTYATAYRALFQRGTPAKLRAPGQPRVNVFVHGASGGVGTAACQLARMRWGANCRIVGTAGSERGVEAVRAAGADVVVSHREAGYEQRVAEAFGGQGADIIVENAAHANLGKDLPLLSKGGVCVVVGSRGPAEINARDLMQREAFLTGVMLRAATDAELAEAYDAIEAGLASGQLSPLVARQFKMEEISTAHEHLIAQPGGAAGRFVMMVHHE